MTRNEIKMHRKANPRFDKNVVLTEEQRRLHRELDCREMINSCLCYGHDFIESNYSKAYIEDLGKARVIELYNEQKEDFSKSQVIHNTFEDGEGNSYNTIRWYDEVDSTDKDITDEMF